MSDVFISYARSTAAQAHLVSEGLRACGFSVWRDDELPAHRAYADVIEERLREAKAVLVIWSAEAVKSQWVQSEADRARQDGKLVQLALDDVRLPMPFDRIQCAKLIGWTGDLEAPGWRKVTASIGELLGASAPAAAAIAPAPLPLPAKPSIAVMPFVNLSGDPGQAYFADGMVEEVVTALSRFKSIFVISSGSTLSFKGRSVSPQDAARQLGVRYVLEGSVRQAGGRVRITVKLTDASDGAQIWADRFDDTLEDVFALQDKVALSAAGQIEPTLLEAEIRCARARPTANIGAYDLYLRALVPWRSWSQAGMTEALEFLRRAIALDPDYAEALALAAGVLTMTIIYGWTEDPKKTGNEAQRLAHRALSLAPDDPSVLTNATVEMMILEPHADTVAMYDRALALNPGACTTWAYSGWARLERGREQAVEHLETAIRLDPLSAERPTYLGGLGLARLAGGRFGDAVTLAIQSAQLRPDWPAELRCPGGGLWPSGRDTRRPRSDRPTPRAHPYRPRRLGADLGSERDAPRADSKGFRAGGRERGARRRKRAVVRSRRRQVRCGEWAARR